MAILQISKIQQRSGNLVDLPQLDEAEFGWANDTKRLFIGKTTPNENIEILTSYSQISFSQIDGSVGNLNVNPVNIANGQILTYTGTDWTNRGGDAGGLITLGDVSNVKIAGGATGYVLQTDGSGNLSWTPKGTLAANILNVTKANPAVVTTTSENFFENGAQVTFIDPQGMTELAGNIYYADALTANTFALYTDSGLTSAVNSTSYNAYSYTTVSATTVSTNVITVANSSPFTVGAAVQFIGDMSTSNIFNNTTYYVQSKPNTTSLKIATSSDGNASNVIPLQTTSGLTAEVYQINGQAIATVGSTVSFPVAGGANTQVQYNGPAGALTGSSAFTFDYGANLLTLAGNANIGNVSISSASSIGTVTANVFISNVSTGTAPLTVTSTTRVSNLNVSYSNVTDFSVITNQTVGTFYPVFVSSSGTGNRALGANANISFNASTGNLTVTILEVTANIGANNIAINNQLTVGANANVTGNLNVTANANITANLSANNGAIGNLLTVGANANVTGNLNVTANANVTGRLNVIGVGTFTANANVSGNLNVTANANITANVNANNVTASNAVSASTATITGNIIAGNAYANSGTIGASLLTGTLTTAAQPNITSVGTLTSVAVTGNVTAGNVYANSGTIGATNLTGTLTTAAQPNITSVGTLTSLAVSGNANIAGNINFTGAKANLGSNSNVIVTGGSSGQLLSTDGSGNLSWVSQGSVIGGAAGSNTQVQYNALGLLAASANFTFNYATNALAVGGNITSSNLVATSYHIRSITTGISAAGSTQLTATALTKEINVVSTVSSGQGVVLPAAVAGMVLIVNNTSANTLNVYPALGGAINSGATNAAYSHSSGASIQYYATSGTQWYTVGATFA